MACKINLPLPSGFSMPILGFGTWQAKEEELENALEHALSAGYRHIDTAARYGNEHVIGRVLKRWIDAGKLKREDLFITTKLPLEANRPSDVEQNLNSSLQRLQLDYVDLYLIHIPFGCFRTGDGPFDLKLDPSTDLVAIWKEFEKHVDSGKIKSIGVSNFNINQVEKIIKNARILPSTNQVEWHAYLQQPELVEYLHSKNVTVTAYAPLGSLGAPKMIQQHGGKKPQDWPNVLEDPTVLELSKKHGKTAAQILLRHIIQKNIAAIPKSTNPERIKQNIDVFNFELDSDDMKKMNALNRNFRAFTFDFFFKEVEDHPEYPFK